MQPPFKGTEAEVTEYYNQKFEPWQKKESRK